MPATEHIERTDDRGHVDAYEPAREPSRDARSAYNAVMFEDRLYLSMVMETLSGFSGKSQDILFGLHQSDERSKLAVDFVRSIRGTLIGIEALVREAKSAKRDAEETH